MNFLTAVFLSLFLLLCSTKILAISDVGAKAVIDRIEGWRSNILKQKVINQKCLNQLNKWYDLLEVGPVMADNWAWRMFDAWDKLNPGFLTGNTIGFGQMDECLGIDEIQDGMSIKGQYCFSGVYLPIRGVSDPSSSSDINTFADNIYEDINRETRSLAAGMLLSICIPHECNLTELLGAHDSGVNKCQIKDKQNEWDNGDWAFIIFMIVIGVLVFISTCYDWYLRHNDKKPAHPITLAFSFYTNGEQLLKISHSSEQLQSLNGIRALSMIWIVVFHRFDISGRYPAMNKHTMMKWMQSEKSLIIAGGPLAVDSFFFLTGIVMAYGFMKSQCKPKARFNIVLFYVHRYLRLTPAMVILYFFHVTVTNNINSGPMWPMGIQRQIDICLDNAVGYFLHMQNILYPSPCLGHTWYISVDMQFYIISPLILIPMVKYPKYVSYGLVALILLSILPPALITYFKDLLLFSEDYMKQYYMQPYTRIGPWLVGLLLGYILYQMREREIKINRIVNLCMWAIVLVGMFFILWFTPKMNYTENVSAFALYNGFHRLCWALGLMWIVFACQKGYGGFVNWFLTLSIFEVWSRISYSVYLLHMLLQHMDIYRKRAPIFFDLYDLLNEACGDLLIVSVLAFFYCMMFESPIVVIEKVLLGPNSYIIKGMDTLVIRLGCGKQKQYNEERKCPIETEQNMEKPPLENEKYCHP